MDPKNFAEINLLIKTTDNGANIDIRSNKIVRSHKKDHSLKQIK